jgi:hypothetical protein
MLGIGLGSLRPMFFCLLILTLFFIQYISYISFPPSNDKLTGDVLHDWGKRSKMFTVFPLIESFSFAVIWREIGDGEEDSDGEGDLDIEADGVGGDRDETESVPLTSACSTCQREKV